GVDLQLDAARDRDGRSANTRHTFAPSPLPDVAEDFAADVGALGLGRGHDALRGRDDRDAQTAQDARHVLRLRVDPQARLADALQPGHDRVSPPAVAEMDLDVLLLLASRELEVADEAL